MKSMLVKEGWKKGMVEKNVPFLPISGWMGGSLHEHAVPANSEKEHLSIVICGHVDSGKSTSRGCLIFEL